MGLSKAAYSKSALEFDVFQVSLTSGAKTDTDTWQMTDLESQRLIQWNASAATREALLWRKGLSNSCTRVSSDNSRFNCDRSNMNSVKEMWHFLIISCFRRERALSRSSGRAAQRAAPAPAPAPAVFNRPPSPTSTWSPTPSPTSPLPTHVYYAPVMDEPLALIKKPRKDPENTEEKTKSSAATQIQVIDLQTQRDGDSVDVRTHV